MKHDAHIFLNSLKTYLYGDLEIFIRICKEIEQLESTPKTPPKPHITESFSASRSISTSTPTFETTKLPGLFGTSGYGSLDGMDSHHFRSTIPHALAVFAAIDILGFLIGEEKDPKETRKNIALFVKDEVTNLEHIESLIFICRHGMSHTFFPKERIAIAAHSSLEGQDLFFLDETGIITLNLNSLIGIFKRKFEMILADKTLESNIETQFEIMVKIDKAKLSKYGIDLGRLASALKHIPTL